MPQLAYDILVNIIGGVLSAVLVLYFLSRWKNVADLRWQLIRLRNILYEAETNLDPRFHRVTHSGSVDRKLTRYSRVKPTAADWHLWHNQCDEIRFSFFEIADRFPPTPEVRVRINRPREDALGHFQTIKSVFAERVPTKCLGVIECATDTSNLLDEARRWAEDMNKHADEYEEFLKEPQKPGADMSDTSYYEKQLEEVRSRIRLHREYVQTLVPPKAVYVDT